MKNNLKPIAENGYFGTFGGSFIPESLQREMDKIAEAYEIAKADQQFQSELDFLRRHYQGRPTPITHAKNLSRHFGGAQIFLKREDLNHTGAHKLNHCMGECLLAKRLKKRRVIGETGAGQHGVALATAAAYLGLECEIHMGEVDIAKERPNVQKMRLLGAKIIAVPAGQKSLKEATDSAFEAYFTNLNDSFFCVGSVVGPHPFPTMVRDFQSVIGREARQQMLDQEGILPDAVVACVGGGSNAMGIFSGFLGDLSVSLFSVEPLGRGSKLGDHAASISFGTPGILHGFRSFLLQNVDGSPAPVYSIASGLDYPGVGPEHAHLHETGRVKYVAVDDKRCLESFYLLPRCEGLIIALESAHATAYAAQLAREMRPDQRILVNLSGRGDKYVDFVLGLDVMVRIVGS